MARPYRIPADARRAITTHAAYKGSRVTLAAHIGDAWPAAKTTLERLGASYVVGSSAFEFEPDQDAQVIVSGALTAGTVLSAAAADGYVPTPAGLAAEVVSEYGELTAGGGAPLSVLEPSAGVGHLVKAVTRGLGPEWLRVTAVEPDARRAARIDRENGIVTVEKGTFEAFAQRAHATGTRFDRVIMNPPFSVPGSPALWASHLITAFGLLAPGGRLAAIVPAAVLTGADARLSVVRDAAALVRRHGGGHRLDADAFAQSNVTHPTAAVWLDAPPVDVLANAPAPGGELPAFVSRPYTGAELAVTVTRPFLTRGAALVAPLQAWYDGWRNAVRTMRYRGECVTCDRPVWAFDDGENDPRGALGDAAPDLLDPAEDGAEGLPVAACFGCMNDGRTYERAWRRARAYWATATTARTVSTAGAPAAVGRAVQPALSGWGSLIGADMQISRA